MSQAAEQVAILRRANADKVIFDFAPMTFIRPAGVVFFYNMIGWLASKNINVVFRNADQSKDCNKYLDDSGFFLRTIKRRLWNNSSLRSTTLELQKICHSQTHSWLGCVMTPWLCASSFISKTTADQFKVCLSELFNNIQEHTQFDIGSIFAQHFPREKRIIIALADFGRGIPFNVQKLLPGISDEVSIIRAVDEGFTTKSIPTNQGNGLDILLKTVVGRSGGRVTIYSRRGIVAFAKVGTKIEHTCYPGVGFCPGTTIEIDLKTDRIIAIEDDDEEDFLW